MKSKLSTLLALLFLLSSCYSSYQASNASSASRSAPAKTRKDPLPPIVFYVDKNHSGTYEPIELTKEEHPIPKQGQKQWVRDFYGSIKYPALARENGVSGVVILEAAVDQTGKVTNVVIKKGISKECDEETKRAFLHSTQRGYAPLMVNTIPVKFKMEIPVGFWLE